MTNFSELEFHPMFEETPELAGVGARLYFSNGYGVSVVLHGGSYGHEEGRYELAVLNPDGELCYVTPVTKDVLGWLSEDAVTEAMQQVEALPRRTRENVQVDQAYG